MKPSTLQGDSAIWNVVQESALSLADQARNKCKQLEINFCVWRGGSQTYHGTGISRGFPGVGSEHNGDGKSTLFAFVTTGNGKVIVKLPGGAEAGRVKIQGGMADELWSIVEPLIPSEAIQ